MKYPLNVKTKKQKLVYWLLRHIFIFEQGKGQVFGRILSIYTEVGMTILLLDRFGVDYTFIEALIFVVLVFVILYGFGYFYLHYSIDKINTQISLERNPQLMEIHKRIVGNNRDQLERGI